MWKIKKTEIIKVKIISSVLIGKHMFNLGDVYPRFKATHRIKKFKLKRDKLYIKTFEGKKIRIK